MTRIPAARARRLADPNASRRERIQSEPEAALSTLMRYEALPEPELEWTFHPVRRWRFDFAWPGRKLAVEVEGGTYIAGRHSRGMDFERDAAKYNEATLAGWRVLRVTPAMIDDGRAVDWIKRAFT